MAIKDMIGPGIGFSPGTAKWMITRGLLGAAGGAVPTHPGEEFTVPASRLHFTVDDQRLHYTLPSQRLHWTVEE